MSVNVKKYLRHGKPRESAWEVDIYVTFPDGRWLRKRYKAPASSRSGALRWGREVEHELLFGKPKEPEKDVPTVAEFAPRFVEGYARANRQKPSGVFAKESVLRIHLLPNLGKKKLYA